MKQKTCQISITFFIFSNTKMINFSENLSVSLKMGTKMMLNEKVDSSISKFLDIKKAPYGAF
ncbi:hypothetical protein Q674_07865 [Acinetobacter sp. COS3]|nr:hypothetical protein Q674_07865 [Acinetobacter sp. COS3]